MKNRKRRGATLMVGVMGIIAVAVSVASCSGLNREGPLVTCNDLKGGTINACQQGIIASCKDGKTVTYQVCTDGNNPDQVCGESWQAQGAYQCTQSSTGTGGTSTASCPPLNNSACASCLRSTCTSDYGNCVNDPTCSTKCTGPLAAALVTCIQQCSSESNPQCGGGSTPTDGGATIAGDAGVDAHGASCGPLFHDSTCDPCFDQNCCSQTAACQANTGCTTLLSCEEDCGRLRGTPSFQSCKANCRTTTPSGVGAYDAVMQCATPVCPGSCVP